MTAKNIGGANKMKITPEEAEVINHCITNLSEYGYLRRHFNDSAEINKYTVLLQTALFNAEIEDKQDE